MSCLKTFGFPQALPLCKPLITTLAAGAEAPAWLNSQGGLLFIFSTTTGSLGNLGYPTSGGRPKTPFAQNACQARKSKVSLEICEIAFRTKLSFRNASISAVFVVTGAFRGFKWSLGVPHRCAGFQPECRRNGFEGIRGDSRGLGGKARAHAPLAQTSPVSRETAPKISLQMPPQGQKKPDFEGDGLQMFPRQLLRAQVAHHAWDWPQSRPLWIASIFKLLNSEVPAIMKSSKTTKTIENFQKLQ